MTAKIGNARCQTRAPPKFSLLHRESTEVVFSDSISSLQHLSGALPFLNIAQPNRVYPTNH